MGAQTNAAEGEEKPKGGARASAPGDATSDHPNGDADRTVERRSDDATANLVPPPPPAAPPHEPSPPPPVTLKNAAPSPTLGGTATATPGGAPSGRDAGNTLAAPPPALGIPPLRRSIGARRVWPSPKRRGRNRTGGGCCERRAPSGFDSRAGSRSTSPDRYIGVTWMPPRETPTREPETTEAYLARHRSLYRAAATHLGVERLTADQYVTWLIVVNRPGLAASSWRAVPRCGGEGMLADAKRRPLAPVIRTALARLDQTAPEKRAASMPPRTSATKAKRLPISVVCAVKFLALGPRIVARLSIFCGPQP